MPKLNILMVCLGNICRSPLAHGLLRKKVSNLPVKVDSAGTASYHIGEPPDVRMIKTARQHGINISDLRGMQFRPEHFKMFDLIYAMDESNYQNILALASGPADEAKVKMILNETEPGANHSVPDPYYGGDDGFENVYQLLDEATDIITEKLKNGKL
jgi:protein-tyrosine phosphatase